VRTRNPLRSVSATGGLLLVFGGSAFGCHSSGLAQLPTECDAGGLFEIGERHLANDCVACQNGSGSGALWLPEPDGTTCGSGFCFSGACSPGCEIGGQVYPSGQPESAGSSCSACVPEKSTSSWSWLCDPSRQHCENRRCCTRDFWPCSSNSDCCSPQPGEGDRAVCSRFFQSTFDASVCHCSFLFDPCTTSANCCGTLGCDAGGNGCCYENDEFLGAPVPGGRAATCCSGHSCEVVVAEYGLLEMCFPPDAGCGDGG